MVTIKDISKRSGYSVTTVSKALNNYTDISVKTKEKILNLCDEMGYIPNLSARSLVTQKSYTIGIIYEEVTGVGLQHPLFSKILEQFKTVVEASGYDIMFLSKSMGEKNGSYLQHSLRKQVDAILVLCAEFNSKEMHDLYQSDLPKVVIDFDVEGICNITSNNEQGVEQAIKYLRDLGHKAIGTIYGGNDIYIGHLRKKAFDKAMQKYNLAINKDFCVSGEFFSKEDGYLGMKKILKQKNQPTAIFCASDMLAIGAMQAIREAGLHVPTDYSIIGFDGIDVGQILTPKLTTISQNTTKIGNKAANQILKMMKENKQQLQDKIVIDTYLITGETTRVIR